MSVRTLRLCAYLGVLGMLLAGLAKSLYLHSCRVFSPERLDKLDRFIGNGPDCLCPSMIVNFGHRGLINTLDPTIKSVICSLESHLHKCIRREAHGRHEVLSIVWEIQSGKFI